MKQKSIRINIAVVPPPSISRAAKSLSKKLRPKNSYFSLDQKHLPHLTVYLSNYPNDALPKIKKALAALPKVESLRFSSPTFVSKPDGYVEIRYTKTKALEKLQKQILLALDPLRTNIPAHAESMHLMSRKALQSLKKFGYPAVGELYNPHLTLMRLKKPAHLEVPSKAELKNFSFETSRIAIFLSGEHDSCRKMLSRRR